MAAPKKAATKAPTAPAASDPNVLRLPKEEGKSDERIFAEVALSTVTTNGVTARLFSRGTFGESDLGATIAAMREKAGKVQAGDLSELEATLLAQAVALNAIFTELSRRAALNMGEHLAATEAYLRHAFKAQAQCRATLQTLAEIKNPRPVAFVKQANIAHGPQQVNNGTDAPTRAREEKTIEANELLEVQHGERLDTRTAGAASGDHSQLETVGAIDRAAH
jgi:hypothetical protein